MSLAPEIRNFRLSPGGVECDSEGLRVGSVVILAREAGAAWRVRDEAQLSRDLSCAYGFPVNIRSKRVGLDTVASALRSEDLARAQIATLLLQFPDPPSASQIQKFGRQFIADSLFASKLLDASSCAADHSCDDVACDVRGLAHVSSLERGGFNPDEPRDRNGRWTTTGEDGDDSSEDFSSLVVDAAYQGGFHDDLARSEIEQYRKTGVSCLSEVRLSLGVNTARIDILCQTKLGGLIGVEIKTGVDPRLSQDQTIVYSHSLLGGLSSPDGKISGLGFSPDEVLPPFPIFIVYAEKPDGEKRFFGPLK